MTGDGLVVAFDATPDVEPDEVRDLVALRDRFGLSAADVYHGLPVWEVELLLAVVGDQPQDGQDAAVDDPWAKPPDLPI